MINDKKIINDICDFLDFKHNSDLTEEFISGMNPNLLNYEKLDNSKSTLPALQRYLIGYDSHIKHVTAGPLQYYDIGRACRHTISFQFLHTKLNQIKKIKNYEERLNKLKTVLLYDEFESILFELLVGAKYSSLDSVKHVEFIPENKTTKQPDIFLQTDKEIFVECKRMNRTSNEAADIRNYVRKLHHAYLSSPNGKSRSLMFNAIFHIDPRKIKFSNWLLGCETAIRQRTVETEEFVIFVQPLKERTFGTYVLYPSPMFMEDEYEYKEGEPWHGLVHMGQLNFAHLSELHYKMGARSTILNSIGLDTVLKWGLSSPEVLNAYTKINPGLLFKGLEQLKGKSNTILHFAFERDKAGGHRQENIMNLLEKIAKNQKDRFGWIIFNELVFSVSRKGRFDLVEHAHRLGGPDQFSEQPLVSNVFTDVNDMEVELGEFGIGQAVDDIDLVYDTDESYAQARGAGPAKLKK